MPRISLISVHSAGALHGAWNVATLRDTIRVALTGEIITKVVEAAVIIAVSYVILLIVKALLHRLQRREIISGLVEEQVYRLFSLFIYGLAGVTILYMFTSAHEVFYVLLVVLAAILFANWQLIANVSAYYVLLLSRHAQRTATLVEYPGLRIRGKIIEITPLYVKLRTPGGRIAYIPNMKAISEETIQLTTAQTAIKLSVEAKVDSVGMAEVNKIEAAIRHAIEETRLVPRPQDVVIRLVEAQQGLLRYEVETPIAGAEPRPAVVNTIIAAIAEALGERLVRIAQREHI